MAISQGPRRSMVSKATCAAPSCKAPSPCRGLRPHHARKDRVGTLGDLVWPAVAVAIRAVAGRRGAEAAVEQARSRTSLVVLVKRPNKAAMSGGGGRGGKGARSEGWQTTGDAPGAEPDQASCTRRLPADRRCGTTSALARSRPTSDKSPVRESPHAGICAGGREKSLSLPRQPRKNQSGRRRRCHERKAKRGCAPTRAHVRSCVVEDPGMSGNSSTGNRETSTPGLNPGVSSPHREGDEPKPMMHGDEGSDSAMSHCEASERGRATGGGVRGAKGGGQGERATGRHAPDTEPARRVPRPGTRTAKRKAEEGGTVHRAPAPRRWRSTPGSLLGAQARGGSWRRWRDVGGLRP